MSVRRRRWYWLMLATAFCAAAVTFGVFLSRRDRPNDEARIQGVWVSDKPSDRLTVTGYLIVDEFFGEMCFRLEPRPSPKRIIVYPGDRPFRPQWCILGIEFGPPVGWGDPKMEGHGIYELEGDRLRICLPPGGTDFRKSFDAKTLEYHRP